MEEQKILMFKQRPLMRKDNLIYYGYMSESHVVVLQILDTKEVNGTSVATRVSVQLQLTDPAVRPRERIVHRGEKAGIYPALDLGSAWLNKALSGK